jgi:DNA replication protein DnaC
LFARLMTGRWVGDHQNVLICGPTGVGKTFLACALANQACRQGRSAFYVRLPRLLPALAIGRADGSYARTLAQLAKTDVLVIDDWGLAQPPPAAWCAGAEIPRGPVGSGYGFQTHTLEFAS